LRDPFNQEQGSYRRDPFDRSQGSYRRDPFSAPGWDQAGTFRGFDRYGDSGFYGDRSLAYGDNYPGGQYGYYDQYGTYDRYGTLDQYRGGLGQGDTWREGGFGTNDYEPWDYGYDRRQGDFGAWDGQYGDQRWEGDSFWTDDWSDTDDAFGNWYDRDSGWTSGGTGAWGG
jgi:hypothetical protein